MKYVRGKIPAHVVAKHGSARAFKKLKRIQLKAAQQALSDLRVGCAFFPCGIAPVDQAARALEEVAQAISAKRWGR